MRKALGLPGFHERSQGDSVFRGGLPACRLSACKTQKCPPGGQILWKIKRLKLEAKRNAITPLINYRFPQKVTMRPARQTVWGQVPPEGHKALGPDLYSMGFPLLLQGASGTIRMDILALLRPHLDVRACPGRADSMQPAPREVKLLSEKNDESGALPGELECPRCKGKLLPHTLEGIGVRVCADCAGLWMGSEQFRDALKKPPPQAMEESSGSGLRAALWEESGLRCPVCNLPMSKGHYAYSSGVIIDRCQTCKGIWLDRGELAKLRAFAHKPVPRDRLLMAQMQAQTLKRRAQARELAQTREMSGGVSLGQILKLIRDILS